MNGHATTNLARARRLRWLLLAGSVLIGVAVGYAHFYLYLPMGSGPAGPAVEAAAFEQTPSA